MKITPQRAELIMEALQLREFGWTQQQIADCLNIPQTTVGGWLQYSANGKGEHVAKRKGFSDFDEYVHSEIKPHPIHLFPCLYIP